MSPTVWPKEAEGSGCRKTEGSRCTGKNRNKGQRAIPDGFLVLGFSMFRRL